MHHFAKACEQVTQNSDSETLYIIHAGTNDVMCSRSEELMDSYRKVIRQFKTKTDKLVISAILPRICAESSFYSKAYSVNKRLKTLCSEENVSYVNLWDDFYNMPSLFQPDGLHLNSVGAARLGRLLNDQVSLYKSKNGVQTREAVTT